MKVQLLIVIITTVALTSAKTYYEQSDFALNIGSQCSICQGNKVACTSENGYKICSDGKKPSGPEYPCNDGLVCTGLAQVCAKEVPPVCVDLCGKCDSTKTFACTSTRQFALCMNEPTFGGITGTCDDTEFCNIEEYERTGIICSKSCVSTSTCSSDIPIVATTTTTTTTVAPSHSDAGDYCRKQTKSGFYGIDCKVYYYCEIHGKEVTLALALTCPENKFYDQNGGCVDTKPDGCEPTTTPTPTPTTSPTASSSPAASSPITPSK